MKKLLIALSILVLPAFAVAESKMQNSNPSAAPAAEPTLGHHMQNRDPSPEVKKVEEPTLGHHMQNRDPNAKTPGTDKSNEEKLKAIAN